MKITQQASLQAFNTFQVAAKTGLLVEIDKEEDILTMPGFNKHKDFVLGGGSNVVFVNDVAGTVFLNRIKGIEIVENTETESLVDIGAGENWHRLVMWSVQNGLSGLENLALIPGLAGAAPIQNIGAYGVELASVLDSVTAWDLQSGTWLVLDNTQCQFAYRDSVFKSDSANQYLITSIRLRLRKQFEAQLHYTGLQQELDQSGIVVPKPTDIFSAVIRLRQKKLPDPSVQGNAGSFFKNPVVSTQQLESLRSAYPAIPAWTVNEECSKIPAAWMIDQCGLKGYEHHGAAVSKRHALVLINQEKASGLAIWQLAQHVQKEVQIRFGLVLEPEPKIYLQEL